MIIQVKLLNGFHGRDSKDSLEFPPSPGRLYSALVNGWGKWKRHTASPDAQAVCEALKYLESLPLPDVYFEPVKSRKIHTPTMMVPINRESMQGYKEGKENRAKVEYRCHLKHPFIYYHWVGQEMSKEWEKIKHVLPYISYLGSPKSIAVFTLKEQLPVDVRELTHIRHDEGGDIVLSCYYPGRFGELECNYEDSTRIGHPTTTYKVVEKESEVRKSPLSLYKSFTIFSIEGDFKPLLNQGTFVVEAVRSELLNICNNRRAPTLLGEGETVHVAHLPLASVGSPYSNGSVLGIGIAIPPCDDFEECESIVKQLNDRTINWHGYQWKLTRITDENTSQALKASTWCKPSSYWVSVTPVEVHSVSRDREKNVLYQKRLAQELVGERWDELRACLEAGYDDNREEQYAAYIVRHCQQMKLPEVEHVSVSYHPMMHGSVHSRQFVSRNSLKNRPSGHLVHCSIRFANRISGPLSLGRTRNYGMGLMKPVFRD